MRSYLPKSVFFEKMKKKPELTNILSNLDTTTEEYILATKLPKWIKDHLLELKTNNGVTAKQAAYQRANEIALKMIAASVQKS